MELHGKKKNTREANLRRAEELDDGKWSKPTPYHWRRALASGDYVDFWPTTMKAQISWLNSKNGGYTVEMVVNAFARIDELLKAEEDAA